MKREGHPEPHEASARTNIVTRLDLVFEEPEGIPQLHNDEAKVSQILRNFISNALKFTERGEVRVTARLVAGSDMVAFSVADTGISASRPKIRSASSRNSPKSTIRCSAASKAPVSACPSAADWPSCSAGACRSKAIPG